jgi:hypothetical protein
MNRLFAHYRQGDRGRNVYKLTDGTYVENVNQDKGIFSTISPNASGDPAPRVSVTYWGATTTIVDDTEAAALQAAGYTLDTVDAFDVMRGVVWHLKASDLGLNNNDPVSSWSDRSGHQPAVTQSTTAKQPLYKTNVLNGLPVVRFDGVNDSLVSAGWVGEVNEPFTLILVASLGATANGTLLDSNGNGPRLVILRQTGTRFVALPADGLTAVIRNGSSTTTSTVVRSITMDDGLAPNQRVNGTDDNASLTLTNTTNTALPPPFGVNNMSLGARNTDSLFGACDIAEIVLFNRVLPIDELTQAEGLLKTRYGL